MLPAVEIYFRERRTDVQPINDSQRLHLLALVQSPGWPALLDVMEQQCIKQEMDLVNVAASDSEEVLAQHKISKAMWLFFKRVQDTVRFEVNKLYQDEEGPIDPNAEVLGQL